MSSGRDGPVGRLDGRLYLAAVAILLAGFYLRVHALEQAPPGWRDDEVIETTVHAQRVLDGDLPLFFPEAAGHEPLYHDLSAAAIALWGRGLFQVRLVSVFFGLLTLAAHYRLAGRLFGPRVALISTLALAFSFWALMYSRVKVRHVSALPFILLAFDAFLHALRLPYADRRASRSSSPLSPPSTSLHALRPTAHALPSPLSRLRSTVHGLRSTLFLGLSLYTYFAARVAPIILLAFALYLAIVHRPTFAKNWRRMAGMLAGAALVAAPLFIAIALQPGAQARLGVVGAPLTALLGGDPRPALVGAFNTLGMFGFTGDPEALYNLPGRPVFAMAGNILFLGGVSLCLMRRRDPRYAFVFLWLLLGLVPAFVSTPAASFGHAIVAQPAAYLLLGLGLDYVLRFLESQYSLARARSEFERRAHDGVAPAAPWWTDLSFGGLSQRLVSLLPKSALPVVPQVLQVGVGALCLLLIVPRDLHDYFVVWPADAEVRYLYRADIRQAALWLRREGINAAALTGRLSLWDARALELDAPRVQARWFNPEGALLYPAGPATPLILFGDPPPAGWVLDLAARDFVPEASPGQFTLLTPRDSTARPAIADGPQWSAGLRFGGFEQLSPIQRGAALEIQIVWVVSDSYIPAVPAIGNSPDPPPQPFTTFVHLLGPDGAFVAGYDRFDADAFHLRPGDIVVQRYLPSLPLDLPSGTYRLVTGLYNPVSGARFLTLDGQDGFEFATLEVNE